MMYHIPSQAGQGRHSESAAVALAYTLLCLMHACAQVHEVFAKIGKAASLSVLCVYGGSPYEPQENVRHWGWGG